MNLTNKDKVILFGHSMGGLCAREYLQNSSNWQTDGSHHVAKLITRGTPHGGFAGSDIIADIIGEIEIPACCISLKNNSFVS